MRIRFKGCSTEGSCYRCDYSCFGGKVTTSAEVKADNVTYYVLRNGTVINKDCCIVEGKRLEKIKSLLSGELV